MKNRSPVSVLVLSIVTLGIYTWYWLVKTKGEMNKLGCNIPTAWIWLIPIVGQIWWMWKYSEAVEHVTGGKMSGIMSFVLLMILGGIASAILQDSFNKITDLPAGPPAFSSTPTNLTPGAPTGPQTPTAA
jgi:hypothetical protein